MKRSRIVRVILVVLFATAIGYGGRQLKREVGYNSVLKSYSQDLKPGMSRKQVEDYLAAKNVDFGGICCIGEKSALTDVTLIGEEGVVFPPLCSTKYVSITFQFAAVEPHDPLKAYPSDTLKRITIWRHYDCV